MATQKVFNPSNELKYATKSEYIVGHLKLMQRTLLAKDVNKSNKMSSDSFLHKTLFLDNV